MHATVNLVGKGWMGQTMAMDYTISAQALAAISAGRVLMDRDVINLWVSRNTGDFSQVVDFAYTIHTPHPCTTCRLPHMGHTAYPWATEEGELAYNDCMFPCDDGVDEIARLDAAEMDALNTPRK